MSDTDTRPAASAVAVTPSDTVNIPVGQNTYGCRSLYIGTGGNVAVVFPDGTVVTHVGVLSGTILPVQAKRVNATNTTASNILAYF